MLSSLKSTTVLIPRVISFIPSSATRCQVRCICSIKRGRHPFEGGGHPLCVSHAAPHHVQQNRYLFKIPKLPKPFQKPKMRKQYTERRILGYTKEQMYDIVADVGNYKEFIPWCTNSSLRDGPNNMSIGYMEVGFPPIVERYYSNIKLDRPTLVRSVCQEGKLFSHLINEWRFSPGLPDNPKTSTLEFHVDFEFRSQLHSGLATLFFDEVVKTMVKAFLKRAREVHGPESIRPQKPKVIEYNS